MENTKTRGFIHRLPTAAAVRRAVTAIRNLKVETGNRITPFGFLMLVGSLLAGTLACRLLLL